jgi:HD-GYP domain-containing protein (c-di-GMP phosphodiesterase class II)
MTTQRENVSIAQFSREMARSYLVLIKTGLLHDLENKALEQPASRLVNAVNCLLSITKKAKIQVIGDLIYINETPLPMDDLLFEQVRKMQKLTSVLKIREINFTEAVQEEDIMEMVEHIKIASTKPDGADYIQTLDLKKVLLTDCDQERRELPQKQQSLHAYIVALLTVKELVSRIEDDKPSRLAPVKRAMQHLVSMTYVSPALMLGLIRMPRYKNRLFSHLLNTAVIAIILCEKMQADKNVAANIAFTATLHNLDWQETGDKFSTIRELLRIYKGDRHGQERIAVLNQLGKLDGAPAARLISVAAEYERMTSVGDDGVPIPPDEALRRLEAGANVTYDGAVVQLLATAMGVYPVGSAVELADGSFGVVIELPDDGRPTNLPIVKQLKLSDGRSAGPRTIDLYHAKGMSVLRSVKPEEMNFNVTSVFLA